MRHSGSERHGTGRRGARGLRADRAAALAASAAALAAALAGCGGAAGTSAGGVGNVGGDAPAALALGDAAPGGAGFPAVAWGMSAAEAAAALPGATVDDGGVALAVELAGERCDARLGFEAGGLARVGVGCPRWFASMDACGEVFAPARAALDRQLGDSAEENLAAYWTLPGTAVTLACNLEDDEAARLGLYYQPAIEE